MKPSTRPCILLAILLAAASSAAIVEHRWRANVTAPAAAQFPVGRGETVSFVCDLVDGRGAPLALQAGTLAAMYWQTNGMGDVWYSGPATVSNSTIRVTWLPEYDPGAPLVRLFLSAEAPDGAIAHRAFANLRFYETPGTDPDVVPVPERVIDLAPVAVITNSPWAQAVAGLAGARAATDATNAVSDLLAGEVGALPVQSTLEVHRLVLADLWARVDRMAGSSDADAIDDILLALDGLDARLTALEARSGATATRMAALEASVGTTATRMAAIEASSAATPARMSALSGPSTVPAASDLQAPSMVNASAVQSSELVPE